jgi:predicted phosphodiesterase
MLLEPGESAERNEAVYRLAEARERLPAEALAEIAAWPRLRTAEVGGRRILFVHGSPDDPLWGYVYPDSDLSAFDASPYDVVIMGNTHRPFAQTRDGRLIANPGSVGLPRDVGDLASFAVLDLDAGACEHHRVRIDVERLLDWAGDRIAPDTRASFERRADDFVGELGG